MWLQCDFYQLPEWLIIIITTHIKWPIIIVHWFVVIVDSWIFILFFSRFEVWNAIHISYIYGLFSYMNIIFNISCWTRHYFWMNQKLDHVISYLFCWNFLSCGWIGMNFSFSRWHSPSGIRNLNLIKICLRLGFWCLDALLCWFHASTTNF